MGHLGLGRGACETNLHPFTHSSLLSAVVSARAPLWGQPWREHHLMALTALEQMANKECTGQTADKSLQHEPREAGAEPLMVTGASVHQGSG